MPPLPPKRILGANLPPRLSDSEHRELEREHELEERLLERLAEHVRRKSELPPKAPEEPAGAEQSAKPSYQLPPWAIGIIGIISVATGGAGFAWLQKPPVVPDAVLEDMRADVKRLATDVRDIRDYLQQDRRTEQERWDIVVPVLCRHNAGKPFARGIDCDSVGFEVPSMPTRPDAVAWKARADWPVSRRLP
jgi:hypothetical protein